ncbi:MAG: lipopolysaccharide biosynthesis protein [Clostridiales bacterium]|nr:lipopolysaccharide biosynthesis protein [Clostridiales bacterium]
MKHEASKKKVIVSLFWKFSETLANQGINLLIMTILARLLSPSDFGVVGLVTVYLVVSNILITGGFSNALIRKKTIDDADLSTVFYIYMMMAIVLYACLFSIAPAVASFYEKPILKPILRALGLNIFPGAVNSIQEAVVVRSFKFKMYFYRSLVALVISGAIGISMAYSGYGVWSLVIMQMVSVVVRTTVLWFTVKWRPKFVFSFEKAKELFSYGYKLLISNLIKTAYDNVYSLIIGKVYDTETLGYYSKGNQFPSLIMTSVDGTISSVMLPTLSSMQDDKKKLKKTMRQAIGSSSFLLCPMMLGLAVVARPLVLILLGEKWLPAVPFLQLSSFAYIFWPMQTSNGQALQALGRSDLHLKLGLIKRFIGVILLLVSLKFGIYAMMGASVLTQIIGSFVQAVPNTYLLGYGAKQQVLDIVPALILSIIMAVIIYPLVGVIANSYFLIIAQVSLGATLYLLMAKLFKLEAMKFMFETFKMLVPKNTDK